MFNCQCVCVMFVGDLGIESVGSLNFMIYFVEFEVEGGKECKESVIYLSNVRIDILNFIYESEMEFFDLVLVDNVRNMVKLFLNFLNDDLNKKKQFVIGIIKVNGSCMMDILGNLDLYEFSLV